MKKTTKIIIILAVIIVAALLIFLFKDQTGKGFMTNTNKSSETGQSGLKSDTGKVEYMGTEEKNSLNIPDSQKIQVLSRDEEGMVTAYKIINSDSDVVTDYVPAE